MDSVVCFIAIDKKNTVSDYFEYCLNIVKKIQESGFVAMFCIGDKLYSDDPKEALFEDDQYETSFYLSFIRSDGDIHPEYCLCFTAETFNNTETFLVDIFSCEAYLQINDNYLEQLKLCIKNMLVKDWGTIEWLYDKDASLLSADLYKDIYDVENKTRRLITEVMYKQYGADWWESFVPKSIKDKHRFRLEKYKRRVSGFNNIDDNLLGIDIGDLISILQLEKCKWIPQSNRIIDAYLSGTIDLSEEQLKNIIKEGKAVETNLWKDCFSHFLADDFLEKISSFEQDRNHVAHNKIIDRTAYHIIKNEAKQLVLYLDTALNNSSREIISKEQKIRNQKEISAFTKRVEDYIKETESNVKTRNADEILEILIDALDEVLISVTDALNFRSDIEFLIPDISGFRMSELITEELVIVQHKVISDDRLQIGCDCSVCDEESATSYVKLSLDGDSRQIMYTNGEAEYDEESGTYIPRTQDEISGKESLTEWLIGSIDIKMRNLVEEVDSGKYERITKGDESPIAEGVPCEECGTEYICVDESIAPRGTCLNCGAHNEVNTCIRCGAYYLCDSSEEGLCESCKACIEEQ